jgi:signal transduction histidine kinase
MWAFPVLCCALVASGVLLRRWPLVALVVLTTGSVVTMALQPIMPASVLEIVITGAVGIEICYQAATRTPAVSAIGVAIVGAGLLIPGSPGGLDLAPFRGSAAVVTIIAWLIGTLIRQAQARAELLRAQVAAQATLAERLRIARELHDMVAHSIGIIAIQAGAGRRVFDTSPDQAHVALAAIEASSRETLSGLRRMVTGLRRAELGPEPEQALLGPAPGLADIQRLAAMSLDAGVHVDIDWRGSREPLPADIDLSAFRIIQEAVTNVARHASTDHCQILLDQQDGQLSIAVTDRGRGGSVAGTGYGITGMRERATLLGGEFAAGPRPGGGFRVAARLPG